jgi:hypothetical protein
MHLPRLQLFEFNDTPSVPKVLRQSIISALSRTLRWGHMLDGLVQPFVDFLAASGARDVLDLASGAGDPAVVLLQALKARGQPLPVMTLTDLQPHPDAWRALSAVDPDHVRFIEEPVDATRLTPQLAQGRARTIINALHHFPPALAQQALLGMAKDGPGVFVAEGLVRNPLSFVAMMPWGIPALLAEPVLAPDAKLQRAALTWLSPVALLASAWDGTVSTFRCYSRDELMAFVEPLGPLWRWEFGHYDVAAFGQGSYFWGVPGARGP